MNFEEADEKGSHYGCEVAFTDADRTSNQWGVISDLPKNCIPVESLCNTCYGKYICPMQPPTIVTSCEMYEKIKGFPNPFNEINKRRRNIDFVSRFDNAIRSLNPIKEEKTMKSAERIEIRFKSGDTISYDKGEWDDYVYDGKAFIVKQKGEWIGIYNFDDVFCVELK